MQLLFPAFSHGLVSLYSYWLLTDIRECKRTETINIIIKLKVIQLEITIQCCFTETLVGCVQYSLSEQGFVRELLH